MKSIFNRFTLLSFSIFLGILIPLTVFAKIGVGVGIGKIQINKKLKPGGIYELPTLPVLNTGDEAGEYEVSIEYLLNQKEIQPPREWFTFNPKNFYLNPGEVKNVEVILYLPINAKPGEYFAFLEAHPLSKSIQGQTRVGVAAAAKLYFTIAPANIFFGIYYRISSFLIRYSPWTWIILGIIILFIILLLIRKNISFQIVIKKKQ